MQQLTPTCLKRVSHSYHFPLTSFGKSKASSVFQPDFFSSGGWRIIASMKGGNVYWERRTKEMSVGVVVCVYWRLGPWHTLHSLIRQLPVFLHGYLTPPFLVTRSSFNFTFFSFLDIVFIGHDFHPPHFFQHFPWLLLVSWAERERGRLKVCEGQ